MNILQLIKRQSLQLILEIKLRLLINVIFLHDLWSNFSILLELLDHIFEYGFDLNFFSIDVSSLKLEFFLFNNLLLLF